LRRWDAACATPGLDEAVVVGVVAFGVNARGELCIPRVHAVTIDRRRGIASPERGISGWGKRSAARREFNPVAGRGILRA